jgi:hypothetical protein
MGLEPTYPPPSWFWVVTLVFVFACYTLNCSLFIHLFIWAYATNLSYSSLHQWKIKYISLTIFLNVFTFNHCVRVQFALHFLQLWVQSNCEKIPINAKVLGKSTICISQIIFFFLVHVTTLMEKWWILDVPESFHDNEFTHMSQWSTCRC